MPSFSRPSTLMYSPFSPSPYARVLRPVDVAEQPGIRRRAGSRNDEIAVVAQPAVQVKRSAPRREPVVRHHHEQIVRRRGAPASRRRSRRGRRRARRRRARRARRSRRRRPGARDPARATSCATPDRRCRSSRRAGRRETDRARTCTAAWFSSPAMRACVEELVGGEHAGLQPLGVLGHALGVEAAGGARQFGGVAGGRRDRQRRRQADRCSAGSRTARSTDRAASGRTGPRPCSVCDGISVEVDRHPVAPLADRSRRSSSADDELRERPAGVDVRGEVGAHLLRLDEERIVRALERARERCRLRRRPDTTVPPDSGRPPKANGSDV